MTYTAPVAEIAFTLKEIAGLGRAMDRGLVGDLDPDLVQAVLEEAGRFAGEQIAPLNQIGDQQGARLDGDAVSLPEVWRTVYRQWSQAGWAGLPCPQDYGGQGLPVAISMAVHEMWGSACLAYGLGPVLTHGAVEALAAHASAELRARYLPKLISGEWTATMNLTEPQAGSDLNALRAKAVPQADGTYRISGTKIFISYGEHDLTDNIVHLVLARLPDAPSGTRGISLFLVPKFLPDAPSGTPGSRNDVRCTGLEHKLGIHASPTCVMSFGDKDGAIGWLVGEENRGLACMFTMMNNARLSVGIQGVAIAERATQHALAYAHERRQGRAPEAAPGEAMSPIAEHPDVRRMLLSMRALTAASRAICYATAVAIDVSHRAASAEARNHARLRANLLTPVAKAFSTDAGVEVASLGIQVHGGMGYVEETGAAQYLRDARITPIYEGTNGIQAIDLVQRKLPQEGGAHVRGFIEELKALAAQVRGANRADFGRMGERLAEAVEALEAATEWMLQAGRDNAAAAFAGATPYLRLFALASGAALLARGALGAAGEEGAAAQSRIATARYFAEYHAPEARALSAVVRESADALLDAPAAALAAN